MKLQAFREDEIAKIYKNKLIYSIIKYNKQADNYKNFFIEKYSKALNLSNSSFDSEILDEAINYLEIEKEKYNAMLDSNQSIIDMIADEIVQMLLDQINTLPNDLEKCKFLFEYIVNTFKYDETTKKYNRDIPFGEDYNFEFYNGIPISKSYKGLLVTKTGLSDSITNLLVYLGTMFNLNINAIACECNEGSYMINTVNIDGNISYLDVTSVLIGRCEIQDACLVDCSKLNTYANFTGINEEGITQTGHYAVPYNFTNLLNTEKRILPNVEYANNSIYTKKKTS